MRAFQNDEKEKSCLLRPRPFFNAPSPGELTGVSLALKGARIKVSVVARNTRRNIKIEEENYSFVPPSRTTPTRHTRWLRDLVRKYPGGRNGWLAASDSEEEDVKERGKEGQDRG